MSRIPLALIGRDWYRPGPSKPEQDISRAARVIERLRRMLTWDEIRRTRQGTWPPVITLPRLPTPAEPGKGSSVTVITLPPRAIPAESVEEDQP